MVKVRIRISVTFSEKGSYVPQYVLRSGNIVTLPLESHANISPVLPVLGTFSAGCAHVGIQDSLALTLSVV